MNTIDFSQPVTPFEPSMKDKIRNYLIGWKLWYLIWSGYFNEQGEPLRCTKCDSWHHSDHVQRIVDTVNGIPCEIELKCKLCGNQMGYWAYGYWDSYMLYV